MAESQDDDDDKTEEATQTRREEFRKRGQVAQTKELASALFFFVMAVIVLFTTGYFFQHFSDFILSITEMAFQKQELAVSLSQISRLVGVKFVYLLGPILLISLIIGFSSSVLQVGFLQVEEALQFKFEKINPFSGFKRIFSLKAFVEGVKALIKIILISAVTYFVIKSEVHLFLRAMDWEVEQSLLFLSQILFKVLLSISLSVVLLALLDYFFQWWDLEKQMRMSKKELKEEHKSREVDPMIKSRMRRLQREMSNRRMMKKVSEADVIVTNPTHISVALKYGAQMPAPQLVAKGADLVAHKIREIAQQNGIPIVENKPLARAIYKTMKLDQFIPRELYVAVAEVLSYVYKLKKRKRL
jgi:flagellar biosynthesis protein FlhB